MVETAKSNGWTKINGLNDWTRLDKCCNVIKLPSDHPLLSLSLNNFLIAINWSANWNEHIWNTTDGAEEGVLELTWQGCGSLTQTTGSHWSGCLKSKGNKIKKQCCISAAGASCAVLCRPLLKSVSCKWQLFVRLAGTTILHCPNKSMWMWAIERGYSSRDRLASLI